MVEDELGRVHCFSSERLGSGDGEREVSMTPQMPYEPLSASVLFGLVRECVLIIMKLLDDSLVGAM